MHDLCFSLISVKYEFKKFKDIILKITDDQWEEILNDTMLLWPIYDYHIWKEEEYKTWISQIDDPESDLFPYNMRNQTDIIALLQIIPVRYRFIFYDDLLIIQEEFFAFDLKNYKEYNIDRKDLLNYRLNDYLCTDRSIDEVKNYVISQIMYLEDPNLYLKITNSKTMDEIDISLIKHK